MMHRLCSELRIMRTGMGSGRLSPATCRRKPIIRWTDDNVTERCAKPFPMTGRGVVKALVRGPGRRPHERWLLRSFDIRGKFLGEGTSGPGGCQVFRRRLTVVTFWWVCGFSLPIRGVNDFSWLIYMLIRAAGGGVVTAILVSRYRRRRAEWLIRILSTTGGAGRI